MLCPAVFSADHTSLLEHVPAFEGSSTKGGSASGMTPSLDEYFVTGKILS